MLTNIASESYPVDFVPRPPRVRFLLNRHGERTEVEPVVVEGKLDHVIRMVEEAGCLQGQVMWSSDRQAFVCSESRLNKLALWLTEHGYRLEPGDPSRCL